MGINRVMWTGMAFFKKNTLRPMGSSVSQGLNSIEDLCKDPMARTVRGVWGLGLVGPEAKGDAEGV